MIEYTIDSVYAFAKQLDRLKKAAFHTSKTGYFGFIVLLISLGIE